MTKEALTMWVKSEIERNFVAETLKEKREAAKKIEGELFEAIIKEILPEGFNEFAAEHPDWFFHVNTLTVFLPSTSGNQSWQNGWVDVCLQGPVSYVPSFSNSKLIKIHRGGFEIGSEALSEDLVKKIEQYLTDYEAISEDEDRLRMQLDELLNPIWTVNELLEVWPEASDYYTFESKTEDLPTEDNTQSLNEFIQLNENAS